MYSVQLCKSGQQELTMQSKALAHGFLQLPPELMEEAFEDVDAGPSSERVKELEQQGNALREQQRRIKAEHKQSEAAAKAWTRHNTACKY